MEGVHVSVKAETLFEIAGFAVTNSFVLSWIAIFIFILIGYFYSKSLAKSGRKSSLFYLLQSIFEGIYGLIHSVLREKTAALFPILGAYFFYIVVNNWIGILPTVGSLIVAPQQKNANVSSITSEQYTPTETKQEVTDAKHESAKESHKIPLLRAATADLNTTFALALVTVFLIQFYGLKYQGKAYLKKFFNFTSPIMFFVGILELISEGSRILSFAFRLFGNILAGEILITILAFLLPSAASIIMIPFFTLEIMAGAIQALVFTMLSAVLVGMATTKAHH